MKISCRLREFSTIFQRTPVRSYINIFTQCHTTCSRIPNKIGPKYKVFRTTTSSHRVYRTGTDQSKSFVIFRIFSQPINKISTDFRLPRGVDSFERRLTANKLFFRENLRKLNDNQRNYEKPPNQIFFSQQIIFADTIN